MYLRLMPYAERAALCKHLDNNGKWRALASMTLDEETIKDLGESSSPTEALISTWDIQNHTVLEIFIALSIIQQFKAMEILKNLVDPKYHHYIKPDGDNNIGNQKKLEEFKINNEIHGNDLKLDINNFNHPAGNFQLNLQAKLKLFLNLKNENAQPVINENNGSLNKVLPQKPKSPLELVSGSKVLTTSDISYVTESAGAIPQIPYGELQEATNNWDPKARLGRGGFGIVFLGTWKCTQVAIKRIEPRVTSLASQSEEMRQSITELHCLNAYRHDNILPVYGYSIGGPHPCLVYQYMSGGCLEKRLSLKDPKQALKWDSRLNIAIGTARGLQFLHTIGDKPLIHGDIKSANILLDPCNNPKIGDFGLAKEGPNSDVSYIRVSRCQGTHPYMPGEFLRARKFSTKFDTYSFGVVLFELATSLPPGWGPKKEPTFLRDHVVNYQGDIMALKDSKAPGGEREFLGFIEIGKLCTSNRARDRPEMVNVLMRLESIPRQ